MSLLFNTFVPMVSNEDKPRHFHNINYRGISPANLNTIVKKQNDLRFQKGRKVSLSEALNCIVKEYREYIGQI